MHGPAIGAADLGHGLRQQFRRGIGQRLKRIIEFRRVLVEHRAHVIRRHRMPTDIEEPQPQSRAMPVGRVGGQRVLEGGHSPCPVA